MTRVRTLCITIAAAAAVGAAAAQDAPHVYTTEELNRKYGPIPSVSQPVDRSTPEDWRWVESFLNREHARIDADRRYELDRRAADGVDYAAGYRDDYSGALAYGAYAPWYGTGYGYGYGYGDGHGGRKRGHRARYAHYDVRDRVLMPPRMPRIPGLPEIYRRGANFPRGAGRPTHK